MSFTIKYIPIDTSEQPKEFQMSVGEFVTVNELRQKVEEYLKKDLKPDADEDDWVDPFLAVVTNKQVVDLISEERFVRTQGLEKKNQEFVAYEREPLKLFDVKKGDGIGDFLICEVRMTQSRRSYMGLYSNIHAVGYSRLHLFRKGWTVKKLRLRIYELMRPMVKNVIG